MARWKYIPQPVEDGGMVAPRLLWIPRRAHAVQIGEEGRVRIGIVPVRYINPFSPPHSSRIGPGEVRAITKSPLMGFWFRGIILLALTFYATQWVFQNWRWSEPREAALIVAVAGLFITFYGLVRWKSNVDLITDHSITRQTGWLLVRERGSLETSDIEDVDSRPSAWAFLFGIGHVKILRKSGAPPWKIRYVSDFRTVRMMIRSIAEADILAQQSQVAIAQQQLAESREQTHVLMQLLAGGAVAAADVEGLMPEDVQEFYTQRLPGPLDWPEMVAYFGPERANQLVEEGFLPLTALTDETPPGTGRPRRQRASDSPGADVQPSPPAGYRAEPWQGDLPDEIIDM